MAKINPKICRLLCVMGLARAAIPVAQGDSPVPSPNSVVVWRADGGFAPPGATARVLGKPRIAKDALGPYALFDGVADGYLVLANPLQGWRSFTIEMLFKPDPTGPKEQRFFNISDTGKRWLTMETRVNAKGQWSLDTFLKDGAARLPLLDETLLHSCGQWHWAALRYDGGTMTSFVDGKKELEGRVVFSAMNSGQTSVGVRLNRVYWFKGAIREIDFHPSAVPDSALRVPGPDQ